MANDSVQAGILGGLAASAVMAVMMQMGKATGMVETPLPVKVERRAERRLGVAEKTTGQQERAVGMAGHMMMGAAFGAGYGALREKMDLDPLTGGALYGMGVYALNVAGLGPALDLSRGPWQQEPPTVVRQVMMHLLYGAVTAAVAEELSE